MNDMPRFREITRDNSIWKYPAGEIWLNTTFEVHVTI